MLSKRERIIAIIAVAAVGFLVLNKFLIGPVTGKLQQLETQKNQLRVELDEAQNLFHKRRVLEKEWKAAMSEGLRNEVEAESKVGRALNMWSDQTRLSLSSVKPERVASDQGLKEMTFAVAGTGSLRSVAQFLWQIETAALPIKVKSVQIGSASEAGDSMSLQLRLSALYLGEQPGPAAPAKPEVNDEDDLY